MQPTDDVFSATESIQRAFLSLYERYPLRKISVDALSREAGYSRSSFYRHYHSVDDVWEEIAHMLQPIAPARYVAEHADEITPTLYVSAFMDYFRANEDDLRIMLVRDDDGRFGDMLFESVVPPYKTFLRAMGDVPEKDIDSIARYMVRAKVNQIETWAKNPERPLVDEMMLPITTVERSFWGI